MRKKTRTDKTAEIREGVKNKGRWAAVLLPFVKAIETLPENATAYAVDAACGHFPVTKQQCEECGGLCEEVVSLGGGGKTLDVCNNCLLRALILLEPEGGPCG